MGAPSTSSDASAAGSNKLCQECEQNEFKYKCPGCGVRSCGLGCVKAHKERTGCTGKRDRTVFVPLAEFCDNVLVSGKGHDGFGYHSCLFLSFSGSKIFSTSAFPNMLKTFRRRNLDKDMTKAFLGHMAQVQKGTMSVAFPTFKLDYSLAIVPPQTRKRDLAEGSKTWNPGNERSEHSLVMWFRFALEPCLLRPVCRILIPQH